MTIGIMLLIVMVMVLFAAQIFTPVMITSSPSWTTRWVMLIVFDNAKVSSRPSRGDMNRVLMVSFMLSLPGVVQRGGLLRHMRHSLLLDLTTMQTAIFLQPVIAGQLFLFSARSRGSFFQTPFPQWKVFTVIVASQAFAALMAATAGPCRPSLGDWSASFGLTTLRGLWSWTL